MGDKVGENPAALRAAVFFAILEKPEGGRSNAPPPSRARVNQSAIRVLDVHWWTPSTALNAYNLEHEF